jgi:hypothetical protein
MWASSLIKASSNIIAAECTVANGLQYLILSLADKNRELAHIKYVLLLMQMASIPLNLQTLRHR